MPHLAKPVFGLKEKAACYPANRNIRMRLGMSGGCGGISWFPYGFTRTAFKILSETFAKFPKIP